MLIDHPGLTLSEISDKVGMELGYFMKTFRKKMGISARRYSRRQN
jgi:YesN/AraC family two-component response regulator